MDGNGESSRRGFLKKAAIAGAGLLVGACSSPQQGPEQAPRPFFEYPQVPQTALDAIGHVFARDLHGRKVPWDNDSDMGKGLAAHGLLDLLGERGIIESRPNSVVPVSYEDDWESGERRVVFSLNFGEKALPLEVSVSTSLLERSASYRIVNPTDSDRNFMMGFYRDSANESQTIRMFNFSGKDYELTTSDQADARFASPLYGDLMNGLEAKGVTIKRDDRKHPMDPPNLVTLEGAELGNFVNAVDGTRGLIAYIMSTMPQSALNFAQQNMRPAQ